MASRIEIPSLSFVWMTENYTGSIWGRIAMPKVSTR